MARHDRILVSPSRGSLVSELLTAQARANQEVAVLTPFDYFKWDSLVRQLGERREGRQQWSDTRHGETARVAVAWWTDHVGRRHHRVIGGNSRDGSCRNLSSTRKDLRPPLWHVYPDRLFPRDRGKGGEWIAVCGCGEVGSPDRLGWMGRCCAVCHDRTQEGETPPLHVPVPSLGPHHGSKRSVVFSPDGALLSSVRSLDEDAINACVRLDELATDGWRDLLEINHGPNCLAFSPDGTLLAGTEGDFGGLFIDDLNADERVLHQAGNAPLVCMAFAPNGMALAAGGPQGLQVWRRLSRGGSWHLASGNDRPTQALAWSPSGDAIAIGGGGQVSLLGTSEDQPATLLLVPPAELSVSDLVFVDGGKGLVCLSYAERRRWWPGYAGQWGAVQHSDLTSTSQETVSRQILSLSLGRLSPDGRWLAWVEPGEAMVRIGLALTDHDLGRVGWDLDERPMGLAFSPDGETLATVGEHGTIKLIPWRVLLPDRL